MPNTNAHPTLTGAEILWASLDGEGATTVFGYPALRKFPTILHILARSVTHPITT